MTLLGTACFLPLQTFLCYGIEAAVFNITQFIFIQIQLKKKKEGGEREEMHCPSFSWQKRSICGFSFLIIEVKTLIRKYRGEDKTLYMSDLKFYNFKS